MRERYVALFRGINVGKAKRIAMADLRALLESLGYSHVRTLLNSGNAVFDGTKATTTKHAERIQATVLAELGVDAMVIVKSAADVNAAIDGNTLREIATDPSRLLIAFAKDAPSLAALQSMAEAQWGTELIHVGQHAAYVWCANGILDSKVAVAVLKNLARSGTTRNAATVEKIQALMQGAD
jgi:uncharacterized protein (DUF1697 family)